MKKFVILLIFAKPALAAHTIVWDERPIMSNENLSVITSYSKEIFTGFYTVVKEFTTGADGNVTEYMYRYRVNMNHMDALVEQEYSKQWLIKKYMDQLRHNLKNLVGNDFRPKRSLRHLQRMVTINNNRLAPIQEGVEWEEK